MIVPQATIDAMRVGFKMLFDEGVGMARPMWNNVATEQTSTHGAEDYGWLQDLPGMRLWEGSRLIHPLKELDYKITNQDYELTIDVPRNAVNDDTIGSYANRFKLMGKSSAAQYDMLVWPALKAGFSTNCFDGQFFFDTDHAVPDGKGGTLVYANTDGGAGQPWFLIDSRQVVKPVILQIRAPWTFEALDRPTDPNVFNDKKFIYGVDGRCAVGFGYPQFAWGSKQPLTAANYAIARAALQNMTIMGRPIGVMPDLLVVPPTLESDGNKIVNMEYGTGGISNEWKNTAKLLVSPWLA